MDHHPSITVTVRVRSIRGRQSGRYTVRIRPYPWDSDTAITIWYEHRSIVIAPINRCPFPRRAWRPHRHAIDVPVSMGNTVRLPELCRQSPCPATIDSQGRIVIPAPRTRLGWDFAPWEPPARMRANAVALWQRGVPLPVIATEIDVSVKTLRRWIRSVNATPMVSVISLPRAAQMLGIPRGVIYRLVDDIPDDIIIAGPSDRALYWWSRWVLDRSALPRMAAIPAIQCQIVPERCHVPAVLPDDARWLPASRTPIGAPVYHRVLSAGTIFCLVPTAWASLASHG